MLFLPSLIVFIVAKRWWLKGIAVLIWALGIVVQPDYVLYKLIATAIFYPIIYLIVRFIRKKRAEKDL